MNRKTAIRNILGLVVLGGVSGGLYEFFFKQSDPIPLKLLPGKKMLVAELAEIIIPRTDTPGAKDAKVEDYIIKMITENTDAQAQRSFLSGLRAVEEYTNAKFSKEFIHCNQNEKIEVLKHFENKANYHFELLNKINQKLSGKPFFIQLRDLTVEGYCTSLLGATQGMAYDYIPVKYEDCIPLKPNQLAWATK